VGESVGLAVDVQLHYLLVERDILLRLVLDRVAVGLISATVREA
jgi:hypothetical protein